MPLDVALVGLGQVARVHLEALSRTDAVRVVGAFDQDQEHAARVAAERGIPRVYRTWEELLADPAASCVAVLLPHDLHERYAVEALAAGKHVVCEKPMGQTVEECDRMMAAAEKAGRRLFPVHNRVHDHAAERMAELLRGGRIGEVYLAQTTGFEGPGTVGVRPWLATKRGGGGVLLAQSVHPAYVLRWLLGDVEQVACFFGRRKVVEMTNEDTAVALLRLASGAVVEMTATFAIAHGPFEHGIFLHGKEGYLELVTTRDSPTRPLALRAISPALFGDTEKHEIDIPESHGWWTGFTRMWEDYARAIETGATPRVTAEDGKRAVEIIEAAYRSQESGSIVRLPL